MLTFTPRARLSFPAVNPLDALALRHASRVARQNSAIQCSNITGTWTELFFANRSDFTALASSASEGSIISGLNQQPTIPANFFNQFSEKKAIGILARGILGTTSTPTIIFQVRIGSTQGTSNLSGTSVGVSAAITTQSGVSNKFWELRLDLVCNTVGQGTNNCTLSGAGWVKSQSGFASPFDYPLEPSTPDTATWTSTIDAAVTNYVNISATWSASSASNTITTKQLLVWGYN